MHLLPREDRDHVVLLNDRVGQGLDDLTAAADPDDEDPDVLRQRFELGDGSVHQFRVRHPVRADIEDLGRRDHARLQRRGAAKLGLHPRPFLAQVDPHQFRPDRGKEPDEAGCPYEVGHRIGDRNVVHQRGLRGIRQRQTLDRLAGGADHRGLGECSGQQPRRRPDVVAKQLREAERREQARNAQDDGERHLWQRVALEPAKELRSYFVAGGEEEKIEEDYLHDRRDLDVELSDQNSGKQRPDDDPEAEAPELDAADQETERQRKEDRELGIAPQSLYEVVHVRRLPLTGMIPRSSASAVRGTAP